MAATAYAPITTITVVDGPFTVTRDVAARDAAFVPGDELRWEGSEFHTGVTLDVYSDAVAGVAIVRRNGKGDHLVVDLTAARHGMTDVAFTDGAVVATLGLPFDGPVQTTVVGHDGWQEHTNVESALVALAFHFVS